MLSTCNDKNITHSSKLLENKGKTQKNHFNLQIDAYPNVQIPGSLQSQKVFDTLLSVSRRVYSAPLWSLRWLVSYWQKGACKIVISLIPAIIHTNRTYTDLHQVQLLMLPEIRVYPNR